jgi:molybdopterin molybdotransferase
MISVLEAERTVLRHAAARPVEPRALTAAHGAVLREDVGADRDQPPFDRVMMDGVALAFRAIEEGRRRFRVEAIQRAGRPPVALGNAAEGCVEVMTGAALPAGCDCVIPCEEFSVESGVVSLRDGVSPRRLQFVHRQGSDRRRGDRLLRAGCVLGPPEIAIAASVGRAELRVSRPPAAGVLSTGDELVNPGCNPLPHQVRISNAYAVRAALLRSGVGTVRMAHAADDRAELEPALQDLLSESEILVLSGGVSAGRADLVPAALDALRVRRVFHQVAQRPGRPFWFGIAEGGQPVFALPGNPVSTLVCVHRYVLPWLRAALGTVPAPPEFAVLDRGTARDGSLTCFVPVTTESAEEAQVRARAVPCSGSGDHAALAETSGFLELPPGPAPLPAGSTARLHRWS